MSGHEERNDSHEFKANVTLEAIRGEQTIVELTEKYPVHADQFTYWMSKLLEYAAEIFGMGKTRHSMDEQAVIKDLHAKIENPSMENSFFAGALVHGWIERKERINSKEETTIKRQSELEDMSPSDYYHKPNPGSDTDLILMTKRDKMHMTCPFWGARSITAKPSIGRRKLHRLMCRMGMEVFYQKPNLTLPHHGHVIFVPSA